MSKLVRYTITIPSKKRNSAPVSRPALRKAINYVEDTLTELYGGVTIYKGKGTYKGATGIISEDVSVVECWIESDSARPQFLIIANKLKEDLEQESILISCNNKGELV